MHNKINRHLFHQQLQMYFEFHQLDHRNVYMNRLDHDIYKSNKMIEHLKDIFINEQIKFYLPAKLS